MAQSWMINTDYSSNDSRTSTLAASWLIERSMWAFHAKMFAFAFFTVSLTSSQTPGSMLSIWVISADSKSKERMSTGRNKSHESSWWWPHCTWKLTSLGSLKANSRQWSATVEVSDTCTYSTSENIQLFTWLPNLGFLGDNENHKSV